jgi:transposase
MSKPTRSRRQLAAGDPAAPQVAVICDNVIIHHSKIVQRWLAAHPRVVVVHGARCSPHDNPVERVWGALKAWLANTPTLTIQGRLRQVHAFFTNAQPCPGPGDRRAAQLPWLPEGYTRNFWEAA